MDLYVSKGKAFSATFPLEDKLLKINGRRGGDRTLDFFRVKEALCH
jgi:hypothetical protein